ncbi:hypothetical protein AAFF_G00293430, partial [Aldrovandia affinis]
MGLVLHVLLLALALPGSQSFQPLSLFGRSITHRQITETAILQKTTEVCRAVATAEGREFTEPRRLTASRVQRACFPGDDSLLSGAQFKAAIIEIYLSNAAVDVVYVLSDPHHFDGESFAGGRSLITKGVASVKAGVRRESFFSARLTLGTICHTLQDFYSHSNWIELENKRPNTNLLRADQPIGNLADENTPTCRNCIGENCKDNILPAILQQKILTSGYFSLFSPLKPAGKCSHGGSLDRTSTQDPVGGINKDTLSSKHGHRHRDAANVAINATMELLEDIRGAAGENNFLRLMGISRSSVLCFVIDTTGSMRDDIAEAKRVAFSIIDSKKGTRDEPSAYILVPFNDPGVGPLTRTTDSNVFKNRINGLTANGGGDLPEMSLTGLQLALTSAPRSSEIFVFTDAPAKDTHLRSTVIALIESTKSVVTFLLTNALSARRRRDSDDGQDQEQRFSSRLSTAGNALYQELAEASGGQAIVVTKETLPQVTDIIVDSSTSALVTILQSVRNPGRPDNFTFTVDPSVRNLTIYLTGTSTTFSVSSPSGRSGTDFIYSILETTEGPGGDYTLKEGRPQAGGKVTLLLSVVGGDSPTATEVFLVEVSGSRVENGSVEVVGDGDYLVSMERVPDGQFVILLKGVDGEGTRVSQGSFQRQSLTKLMASSVAVTALVNSTMEPGVPFSLPFTVMTNGTAGTYTIRARDDSGFISSFTPSLQLESGASARGSVE